MDITRFGVGNKSSAEPPIATQAGMSSTYDYSSPIPMDNIQNERYDGFVRPVGGVVGDGPFTFEIPALSDAYLLLNKIGLYGLCSFKVAFVPTRLPYRRWWDGIGRRASRTSSSPTVSITPALSMVRG